MDCIDKIQKCYRCGFAVQWDCDVMSSEISDDFPENDSSVTSFFSCPNCGATMKIMDASDEKCKEFPKFNTPTPDKPKTIKEMSIAKYPDDDSLPPGGMESFRKECTKVVCRTAYSVGAREVLEKIVDAISYPAEYPLTYEEQINELWKTIKELKNEK